MFHIDLTRDVSHPLSGWLKDDALLNMASIRVTSDVSHPLSGWLKDDAERNM